MSDFSDISTVASCRWCVEQVRALPKDDRSPASRFRVSVVNPAIYVRQRKTSIIIRSARSIADPLAELNP